MKRFLRAVVILAVAGGLAYAAFWWLSGSEERFLTGYIEGEALYFAAPVSGELVRLSVERGARVKAGTELFQIDPRLAKWQLRQAKANAKAAAARLRDSRKGQRPEELAVIEAQRAAARATLEEARTELARIRDLAAKGVASTARLDQAQASFGTARARYEEAVRRLASARLGSREDQVAAAEAEAARTRAAVREAQTQLERLSPVTGAAGRVEDVFFRPGEWVPANQPVVSVLPDERIKIRFFVPETAVALYRPGRTVTFRCDGCGPARTARITFVGPRPEYTPPVIYSRDSRAKLVFLVEAVPERPGDLAPGQPVDVVPLRP